MIVLDDCGVRNRQAERPAEQPVQRPGEQDHQPGNRDDHVAGDGFLVLCVCV